MRRYLTLLLLALAAATAAAQCTPTIAPVPLYDYHQEPAHLSLPPGTVLPPHHFLSYKRQLMPSLAIGIVTRFEQEAFSMDDGLLLSEAGSPPRLIPLSTLPEFRAHWEASDIAYTALSVTETCDGPHPVFLIAFHWVGDMLAPEVGLLLLPGDHGVTLRTVPSISGGVIQLSRSGPLRLRLWSSLNEGLCNACETRYSIRDYALQDGQLVLLHTQRTSKLYTSSDPMFDDRIGVSFLPDAAPTPAPSQPHP